MGSVGGNTEEESGTDVDPVMRDGGAVDVSLTECEGAEIDVGSKEASKVVVVEAVLVGSKV